MAPLDRELERIAEKHELRRDFSPEVTAEVQRHLDKPGLDDPELVDLRDRCFVTIDGEGTRDLDQALYAEQTNEGFSLWYALADASYYVRPGSALFEESLRRGVSYYFPSFAVPMLPRALSEGLISLNAGVERRAFVIKVCTTPAGEKTSTTLFKAKIKVAKKLSFAEVDSFLAGKQQYDESLSKSLRSFEQLGRARLRRNKNGVFSHRIDKQLERNGSQLHLVARDRGMAERLNEQMSLLTNIEAAEMLRQNDTGPQVQPIYKVHPSPPPERLERFARVTKAVQKHFGLSQDWVWDPKQERGMFEYLISRPDDANYTTICRGLSHQAILANVSSQFSAQPDRHHGVGADAYARFSAPMREVVGIFTHKEAAEALHLESTHDARDEALRKSVIESAHNGASGQRRIEKDCYKLAIEQSLSARASDSPALEGIVLGANRDRTYVELAPAGLELRAYKQKDRFVVGQRVGVTVTSFDNDRKRWNLQLHER